MGLATDADPTRTFNCARSAPNKSVPIEAKKVRRDELIYI